METTKEFSMDTKGFAIRNNPNKIKVTQQPCQVQLKAAKNVIKLSILQIFPIMLDTKREVDGMGRHIKVAQSALW